jgi:DNA-binding transcriptional ArsR family regulator
MKTAAIQRRWNLDPVQVFSALSTPVRWKLLRMMADGRVISATQAAAIVGRELDGVIKHLQVLRDAGLVHSRQNEDDGRVMLYYIPEMWRTEPDVLDFGFCILDLSAK